VQNYNLEDDIMKSDVQFGVIVSLLLFIIYGGYLNNELAKKK